MRVLKSTILNSLIKSAPSIDTGVSATIKDHTNSHYKPKFIVKILCQITGIIVSLAACNVLRSGMREQYLLSFGFQGFSGI